MRPTNILVEPHAIKRAHRRGIPERGLPLAASYGEPCYYHDHRVGRTLTRRVLARLVQQGRLTQAEAGRLEGATVLTTDVQGTRVVLTTLPKLPKLGAQRYWLNHQRYLRHRKEKRNWVGPDAA